MAGRYKFILHIGRNKTGTSALQQFFYQRREALMQRGILYPDLGIKGSGHHGIAWHFSSKSVDLYPLDGHWQDELRDQARHYETILISSEAFSTRDPLRVARVFPPSQTLVVVYLREHAHYMTSWYQQSIKASNTSSSLRQFVRENTSPHADLVKRWTDVYGTDHVVARVYDRKQFPGRSVIRDFLQLRPEFDGLQQHDVEVAYSSLSGNLLFLKRFLNQQLSSRQSLSLAADLRQLNRLDPSFSGSIHVTRSDVKWMRSCFRHDRRRLERRYGIRFADAPVEIAGSPCPDWSRMETDVQLIVQHARQRKLGILQHLDSAHTFFSRPRQWWPKAG